MNGLIITISVDPDECRPWWDAAFSISSGSTRFTKWIKWASTRFWYMYLYHIKGGIPYLWHHIYVIVSILWLRPYCSLYPIRWYSFDPFCVYLIGKPDMISAWVILYCSFVGNKCFVCSVIWLKQTINHKYRFDSWHNDLIKNSMSK